MQIASILFVKISKANNVNIIYQTSNINIHITYVNFFINLLQKRNHMIKKPHKKNNFQIKQSVNLKLQNIQREIKL